MRDEVCERVSERATTLEQYDAIVYNNGSKYDEVSAIFIVKSMTAGIFFMHKAMTIR